MHVTTLLVIPAFPHMECLKVAAGCSYQKCMQLIVGVSVFV